MDGVVWRASSFAKGFGGRERLAVRGTLGIRLVARKTWAVRRCLGFEGVGLEFGVELGAKLVEVGEGEGVLEAVAGGGCGDEGLGGEGEKGGAGAFGKGAEAIPRGGGDGAELVEGGEGAVEEDEGNIAVAQEEVGGLEGFLGVGGSEPEEGATRMIGGGVEAVARIDEGEGELAGFFFEKLGDEEGGLRRRREG